MMLKGFWETRPTGGFKGCLLLVVCYQLSVVSYRLSVISYRLLVIGYRLSVIGYQYAEKEEIVN